MVDGEHWEGHVQDRDGDEEQRLERLVGEVVPAVLGEGTEVQQDGDVDLEVERRDHERQREGKALAQPGAEKGDVELPAPTDHLPDADHRREVGAAEPVHRHIAPEEPIDPAVGEDAHQRPSQQHDRLHDDRDGLEGQDPGRVKGAPQHVGVGAEDHHEAGRHEQAAEAAQVQGQGQHRQRRQGEHRPGAQDVPQVARDLVRVARALPRVEGVEAEVDQDRDQRRVGDGGLELPVAARAQPVGRGEEGDQCDRPGEDARDQQHGRVADGPGADRLPWLEGDAGRLVSHRRTWRRPLRPARGARFACPGNGPARPACRARPAPNRRRKSAHSLQGPSPARPAGRR